MQEFEPGAEPPALMPAETPAPPPPVAQTVAATDRLLAALEIFFASGVLSNTVAFALMQSTFGAEPESLVKNPQMLFYLLMADTVILFMIIHLFLGLRRRSFRDLGLQPRAIGRNILFGLVMVPGLFVLTPVASYVFQVLFPEHAMTKNPLLEVIQSPRDLAFFMVSGIIAGGLREEVQRAFVLSHFQKYLFGAWPGLLLWSAFFGFMHYSLQGPQGAFVTALLGLCFGVLYLWRKNLYGPIVGHAAYNTISLMVFWYTSRAL